MANAREDPSAAAVAVMIAASELSPVAVLEPAAAPTDCTLPGADMGEDPAIMIIAPGMPPSVPCVFHGRAGVKRNALVATLVALPRDMPILPMTALPAPKIMPPNEPLPKLLGTPAIWTKGSPTPTTVLEPTADPTAGTMGSPTPTTVQDPAEDPTA